MSYYEIVESRDAVVFRMETIHDARVIPLDGRPHPGRKIQNWLDDSRGHWEGDTLVVSSTKGLAWGKLYCCSPRPRPGAGGGFSSTGTSSGPTPGSGSGKSQTTCRSTPGPSLKFPWTTPGGMITNELAGTV
jgi:hypothetical protein